MMPTYRLRIALANWPEGKRYENSFQFNLPARSASDAMQGALKKNPGHVILECWQGNPSAPDNGYVRFDIPKHEPYHKPSK